MLALFTVFVVFFPVQSSLTASPGNYAQIAQHFGFPFPPKLPNISFADVGKQCKETVEKLVSSPLAYPCEYEYLCCL